MPRIRSIHPGYFTSRYAGLPDSVQLLFLGLLCWADDQGIFLWDPVTLNIKIRPGSREDHSDIDISLRTLETAGAIKRFVDNGRAYGAIRNFVIHQRMKKPNAVHPCPPHVRNFVGFGDQGERLRSTIQARNLVATNGADGSEPVRNPSVNFCADNWKGNQTPYQGQNTSQEKTRREDLTAGCEPETEFV